MSKASDSDKAQPDKVIAVKPAKNSSDNKKDKGTASTGNKTANPHSDEIDMLGMIKSSLYLIEKEHMRLKKLKDDHEAVKSSLKESVSALKKDLNKDISSNSSSVKILEKSVKKTEAKIGKVEAAINKSLLKTKEQLKSIMPIITRYDKKSEQYIVQQFKRFEVYSKDIEGTIDSKFDEISLILNNALDTINKFVEEQEDLRRLEIRENIKDHRQIKADINVIKEEFSTIINEYGKIEKDIESIKKSELVKEENHILKLVTDLKKDIKDIDKAIDAEKLNIKKIVSDVINTEKNRIDKSIDSSRKYVDDNVKQLCSQVATLAARNDQLVKLLEGKEKEYDATRSNIISVQSKKIEELLTLLDESLIANVENSKNTIREIKTENESRYDNKFNELVTLLEKFEERDTEREKRLPDLMRRLESTISVLSAKANDPAAIEKNVKDELDRMMSELKNMREESIS